MKSLLKFRLSSKKEKKTFRSGFCRVALSRRSIQCGSWWSWCGGQADNKFFVVYFKLLSRVFPRREKSFHFECMCASVRGWTDILELKERT